jgi:hypothetical protein
MIDDRSIDDRDVVAAISPQQRLSILPKPPDVSVEVAAHDGRSHRGWLRLVR